MLAGKLIGRKKGWSGIALAAGDTGLIAKSTNGINWTTKTYYGKLPYNITGRAATDGAGTIIVPTNKLVSGTVYNYLKSTDGGVTWSLGAIGSYGIITGFSYNNGVWYASFAGTGAAGSVRYSTNLITWSGCTFDTAPRFNTFTNAPELCSCFSIAYNGSTYVMFAGTGHDSTSPGTYSQWRIYSSTDGIAWTSRQYVSTTYSNHNGCVAYGNGHFVVVTAGANIQESTDGITWTTRSPGTSSIAGFYKVTYANGIFMAVGDGSPDVQTSTDGITWTRKTIPGSVLSVTYTGSNWIAIGYSGTTIKAWTSMDNGTTWTDRTLNGQMDTTGGYIYDVLYEASTGKSFIFGVHTKTNQPLFMHISTDNGTTWTKNNGFSGISTGTSILTGIETDGSKYVICGQYGSLIYSIDGGETWNNIEADTFEHLYSVKYSPTMTPQWCCVGDNGLSLTSTDGITWTKTIGSTAKDLVSLTTNGSIWVAGDGSSVASVWTSTNGSTWTERTLSTTNIASPYITQGVAYGNSVFSTLVSDSAGSILDVQTSPDGITWTSRGTMGSATRGYQISFVESKFMCISYTGKNLYTSPDGITWTTAISGTFPFNADDSPVLHGQAIAYNMDSKGNKIYFAASGVITTGTPVIYSTDGITWTNVNGLSYSLSPRAVLAKGN